MTEVRIYVEGGGDSRDSKEALRRGFRQLFHNAGVSVQVVACGRRDKAYKDWKLALDSHSDAVNLLLVDSEGPVTGDTTPWKHLRGTWDLPLGTEERCHLMVQLMESWFLADPAALSAYYGQHFGVGGLPGRENVEEIPKSDVERSLKRATEKTQKGEYHKIRHAADLLGRIDPARVRKRAPHCERLFKTLTDVRPSP